MSPKPSHPTVAERKRSKEIIPLFSSDRRLLHTKAATFGPRLAQPCPV